MPSPRVGKGYSGLKGATTRYLCMGAKLDRCISHLVKLIKIKKDGYTVCIYILTVLFPFFKYLFSKLSVIRCCFIVRLQQQLSSVCHLIQRLYVSFLHNDDLMSVIGGFVSCCGSLVRCVNMYCCD